MLRKARLSYFVTEPGQRLALYGSGCLTVGLFAANFLPHTIGIGYYKEFIQAFRDGKQRELSEKLRYRFERAVKLLNLSTFEKKFVSPFVVIGFDVFNAGYMKSRFGGIVGIPINFEYGSAADIEKSEVVLCDQKINWSSEGGKLLEESLVLSEDEQVFGIAREILILNTHKKLIQSIIPAASWMFVYGTAATMNARGNFYARPLSLRLVLYAICSAFGYGIYSFATDMCEIHYDSDVDKQLAVLGPDVIDAGARFYDKILKKNVALRKLTGENYYTAKGNINYMIRQKTAPLTMRKEFFVSGYKEFIAKEESS
ncbi:transmembrane protein 177 [Toxorhynchites rutilus septentrionalis]|uniref:transmembrane protein 177 n=1 Tax=Toxorhynchites rutilus septentrionalis TaxID=329112 RepID=UPI00247A1BEF|nr:transmembrane protein 177 [Toxorhynchites rutilus septentrionalis]